jgi:CBS-domain-containing membrane protein
VPVVDPFQRVVGVVSEADLLRKIEYVGDEGVKWLPVVDDLGRLVGIVSRGDLLKAHLRPDDEIGYDVDDSAILATGIGFGTGSGIA